MGVYSDISNPMNGEDTTGQKWLRGYQVTDQKGDVKFLTIYPGWYPARTPHIHFKVRGHNPNVNQSFEFTSQVFFDEKVTDIVYAHAPYVTRGEREVRNSQDNVFAQHQMDGTMVGSHLMLSLSKTPKGPGLSGRFSLALNI
jgi:protocatechuate 3,4-dioxygenase beta subunit